MSVPPIVADTSPIIALDRIGKLDLLRRLHGQVLVPPAVAQEMAPRTELPAWIVETALEQPAASRVLMASLGRGESAAIALAVERAARLLLLDDLPARRLAQAIGVPVAGTLAVLLHAKRRGLLAEIKPDIDGLITNSFRVSDALRERVILEAGERPD